MLAAVARRGAGVVAAPDGLARAAAAHRAAFDAVGAYAFYGRTTGVGANYREAVRPGSGHGLRLLRSHAGGAGEPVASDVARGRHAPELYGVGRLPACVETRRKHRQPLVRSGQSQNQRPSLRLCLDSS
jgi:Aromatic amino acid lyase